MSDDEEMEEFDINDEDLRRAYNPGGKRSKMSKEEAMLGIWASKTYSDSEDDDDNDQFSYKNQTGRYSKKTKSNIDFVIGSTSSKKSSKSKILEDIEDEDDNDSQEKIDDKISDEDEYDNYKPNKKSEQIDEKIVEDSDSDEDNMNELSARDNYLLSQFEKKGKNEMPSARQRNFRENQSKPKQKEVSKSEIKDIGHWEKYTKGIGAKLLEKMGWQKGKGIGKEMQGRAIPVEATLRKGKASVGAYGSESKEVRRKEATSDEEIEEEKPHVSQWKKDEKSKKPQYALRTADELIQLAAKQPSKYKKVEQMLDSGITIKDNKSESINNKVKIIDMTGREQRVMHGYESLSQITRLSKQSEFNEEKKTRAFDLPELNHNLQLILDMTEDKILHYDKKLKHYEDMIVSLSYEEKRTKEKMNSENEQIQKMNELISAIDECEKKANIPNASVDELISVFQNLKNNYADEFIIFDLSQLSLPLLIPLLKNKMRFWVPFDYESTNDYDDDNDNPNSLSYCLDTYSKLKNLLNDLRIENKKINIYHKLVWETWMPAFRRILCEISIKEHSSECADLIRKWSSLLSGWILQNILDQIIMPKLTDEVNNWDPLTDTVPIHIWIHPWLTLMKDRLDLTLFQTIRFKLSKALLKWHPSDQSAKAILMPWKPPVFSNTNWDQFIFKNIMPKLELIFENEFDINPSQQNLEPWHWVMSWFDLVPISSFISLLEKSFFPKWLKVLSIWLNSSPNYEEVSKWYIGWKSLLNEKLAQHPNIKSKLSQGLLMMNRSVNGAQVSYTNIESSIPQNNEPTDEATNIQTTASSITTFKDLIEKKASDLNLIFIPERNKFKEGKQVYRLGNLNIYVDRNVAFMLQNGNWMPASIDDIIQKAL